VTRSTTREEPILASWTIHEVLARYPQLLDTLVQLNPAFAKLRNPLLRRVQSRLVTVAQAAQIAQLEPARLVQMLNAAAAGSADTSLLSEGEPPVESAIPLAAETAPPPEAFANARVAATVDARPLIARGEEPFRAIMAAASQVPVGEVLALRNSFEPLPLYDVLGKRGFVHQAQQLGPDDWEVRFLRVAPSSGAAAGQASPEAAPPAPLAPAGTDATPPTEAWEAPSAVVTVDVSDLVPPEPMVRILETLEQLAPGSTLLVHHVRRPVYLYPRLDALGYRHETRDLGPGQVEILIHKPVGGAESDR
jgi:uncharacterized protein (DUF2249 family)